ncbi:hypothetical protein ACFYOR_34420 [Streptomyces griseofuscus]|uniref:hypothetical protein n=1 Tax=Streptomyces TaxID=1883 RepID=UPI0018F0D822|nr:hypothetical protein [Streptomyces sp. CRPSP2-6A1]MBJ7002726.1 hypothetical protein [Streptomyces sp. CRPSP2-6A1]
MAKSRRTAQLALCGVFVLVMTGCSKTQPGIPDSFCHVPVNHSALSPLVPNGDSLKQKYTPFESHPGAQCDLSVDGRGVLSVAVNRWDRAPDPTDWNKVGTPYKYAAQRKVAFPGHASIGSDRAVVEATCNTRTAYVSVVVDFWGDRVEDTPTGYKKLLRFVNDFVPRETKKFGCTK